MKQLHIVLISVFTGLLMSFSLLSTVSGKASVQSLPAGAATAEMLSYVAPGGNCGGMLPCHATIQHAVQFAGPGAVIKVAAGVYSDTHQYPVPTGYPKTPSVGYIEQVVLITKTVTLEGGYVPTDWITPHPQTQPTILDGGERVRVVLIFGDASPTLKGLRITGGNADGWGGYANGNAGGGILAHLSGVATVQECQVIDNHADGFMDSGGGIELEGGGTLNVIGTDILSNTASYDGGGIGVWNEDGRIFLKDNLIAYNRTYGASFPYTFGGGVFLNGSATLDGNLIQHNSSQTEGGGVWYCGDIRQVFTLTNNLVYSNTSGWGGGVYSIFALTHSQNNVFAYNKANAWTGGLFVRSILRSYHDTFVGNNEVGLGVMYMHDRDDQVSITNTIMADQAIGIAGFDGGDSLNINGILWHNTAVTVSVASTATYSVQNQYYGDPVFAADGYHLQAGSAAQDRGVVTSLATDIDGEGRPAGWGPDLGADEIPGVSLSLHKSASASLISVGEYVTYTISVQNTGISAAANVQLTDTLPMLLQGIAIQASSGLCQMDAGWGGSVRCSWASLPVGAQAQIILKAQAVPVASTDQLGWLSNIVHIRSNETANSTQALVMLQNCHVRRNNLSTKYTTVQAAVDAANPGDVIKIAGTCLLTQERNGLRQQVYLDKSLTLRGGYDTSFSEPPDAQANPTTLDAMGAGRVIYINSEINSIIENLRITGGSAPADRFSQWGDGGGIYSISATLTLRNNQVLSNTAQTGGGIYMWDSPATIENNLVANNRGNSCSGLYISRNPVTLEDNLISHNVGIGANTLPGALCIGFSDRATLHNNSIVENDGSGISISSSTAQLLHTTLAHNRGYAGISIADSIVNLVNTILVGHKTGIQTHGSLGHTTIAQMEATLWGAGEWANQQDWYRDDQYGYSYIYTGSINVWGNPAFALDGYHLTKASAALDRGVPTSVLLDIDGQPRSMGGAPDLGADELPVPKIDTRLSFVDLTFAGDEGWLALDVELHSWDGSAQQIHSFQDAFQLSEVLADQVMDVQFSNRAFAGYQNVAESYNGALSRQVSYTYSQPDVTPVTIAGADWQPVLRVTIHFNQASTRGALSWYPDPTPPVYQVVIRTSESPYASDATGLEEDLPAELLNFPLGELVAYQYNYLPLVMR